MTTTTIPDGPTAPTRHEQPHHLAPAGLIGGIGGLVFVASVIVQNGLRAGFPQDEAGAARVVDYYAAHRGASVLLAALFPIGAIGLAAFFGALLSRIARGEQRAPAIAGGFGAAGIVATYTMLMATDLAISGVVHRGGASNDAVGGLWVLHNAVFGVLLASIGVALAGLSAAAATSGVVASWWKGVGLVGALLLLIAAATTPAIIDGSPTMFIGLTGFVVWVAFVVTCSIALLRSSPHVATA